MVISSLTVDFDQLNSVGPDEERAEKRERHEVGDDEFVIFEGEIPPPGPKLGPKGAEASGPYIRNRLRERASFWKDLGANEMIMDWVRNGFMAWYHRCVRFELDNLKTLGEFRLDEETFFANLRA